MHIKRSGNILTMESSLVCPNYLQWNHIETGLFDRISGNKYKCRECNAVIEIIQIDTLYDDKGRVKMQVTVQEL